MQRRRGVGLDAHGRCTHYASLLDVALNLCGTCDAYFSCHRCHEQLCDHPFGRLEVEHPAAVACGVCGHTMSLEIYRKKACPQCGQAFNPACAGHEHLYWQVDADPR
ncbi:CHY zinc finger protein [Corynebacterium tapiri]|uniref:CHY-type domain-containing protein n=1 Tax=Corynebacterium tapiri TaxID=1448266 RepID=A0A5C4U3N8_9CORY|nr:hypothetical protein [Corynebacterium tapiri]TNL96827.1 hypothetical protein FHE74_07340 [Corynebacterium tapiri]